MTSIRWLSRGGATLGFALFLSGCSACTDVDTALLEPEADASAGRMDAGPVRPEGGACPPGTIGCFRECVDPSTDERHCGDCGRACGAGEECIRGSCVCPDGTTCGGGGLGNPDDCGGTSCDALEVCIDSVCRCRAGRTRVEGRCVDLSTDPDNCGAPESRCPEGTVCFGGGCHGGCPDGTRDCDDACVRTAIDPANCGECGNRCDRDEFCARGSCEEYRGGIGCTECPCDACTGEFSTCCAVSGPTGLVACIEADRCP